MRGYELAFQLLHNKDDDQDLQPNPRRLDKTDDQAGNCAKDGSKIWNYIGNSGDDRQQEGIL